MRKNRNRQNLAYGFATVFSAAQFVVSKPVYYNRIWCANENLPSVYNRTVSDAVLCSCRYVTLKRVFHLKKYTHGLYGSSCLYVCIYACVFVLGPSFLHPSPNTVESATNYVFSENRLPEEIRPISLRKFIVICCWLLLQQIGNAASTLIVPLHRKVAFFCVHLVS
uniref:Uncharacterized protein n=1 Tax=Ciona intestinalis TaxID=7719 RepID=H2XYV7_CIOIN